VKDAWIIWFEDPSVPLEMFSGEGAEDAAHRTFRDRLVNWNCHLFRTIELSGHAAFENVSCSQCGKDFGPGDHGFSHCDNHKPLEKAS